MLDLDPKNTKDMYIETTLPNGARYSLSLSNTYCVSVEGTAKEGNFTDPNFLSEEERGHLKSVHQEWAKILFKTGKYAAFAYNLIKYASPNDGEYIAKTLDGCTIKKPNNIGRRKRQ